jgi:phage/plasmid primase-like uncharacterized protein
LPREPEPLQNVGLEAARKAAMAIDAGFVAPKFSPDQDKLSDWNDYAAQHGMDATKPLLLAAQEEIVMKVPNQAVRDAARAQHRAQVNTSQAKQQTLRSAAAQQEQLRQQARANQRMSRGKTL